METEGGRLGGDLRGVKGFGIGIVGEVVGWGSNRDK